MIVLTGAYLSLEVPFAAHLLDVLGGDPTPDDISTMEHFGRLLSGFAVAIAMLGVVVSRRQGKSWIVTVRSGIIVSALCIAATYFALNALAESIGRMAGPEARRDAVQTMLARRALIEGMGAPEGLPAASPGSPEWKAFISVAPALATTKGALLSFVNAPKVRLIAKDAERKVGDPVDVRRDFFDTGFQSVRDAYATYSNAATNYRIAEQEWRSKADKGWEKHWRQRTKVYPPRLQPHHIREIRGRIQRAGAPVPDNWNPDDRQTFYASIRRKAMSDVDRSYAQGMERALGKGRIVPPGLNYTAFLAHPAVQSKIRADLGYAQKGPWPVIRPEMSDPDFMKAVVEPMRAKAGEEMVDMIMGDASKFGPGGEFASAGEEAVKAVYVPAIALVLSLAGAVGHLFKLTWLLAALASAIVASRRKLTFKVATASLVTGLMGAWLVAPANAVTSSSGFTTVRSFAARGVGDAIANVLVLSIDVQSRFQPLGAMIGDVGVFRFARPHLPKPRMPERSG